MGKAEIPQEKQNKIKSWELSRQNLGFKHSHGADFAPEDGKSGKNRENPLGSEVFPQKGENPKEFHEFEEKAGLEFPHSTLSSPPATSLDFPGNPPEAGEGLWLDLPLDEGKSMEKLLGLLNTGNETPGMAQHPQIPPGNPSSHSQEKVSPNLEFLGTWKMIPRITSA